MIKALGRGPLGLPVVILGLSGENVARMAAGDPIRLDLADLGLPTCQVILCYGRTEDNIVDDLTAAGLITSETIRHE